MTPARSRSSRVEQHRAALVAALGEPPPRPGPGKGTGVADGSAGPPTTRIGVHAVAQECPAVAVSVATNSSFSWAAHRAARSVGLAALHRGDPDSLPAQRVAGILATPGDVSDNFAEWWTELDRAGRSAVQAAATAWAIDAVALAHRRGGPAPWHDPAQLRHIVRSHGLVLDAAVDARLVGSEGDESTVHLYLTRSGAGPREDAVARHVALVWSLVKGDRVLGVTLGFRDTLERRLVRIDDDALAAAIAAVVDLLGQTRAHGGPAVVPGRGCRWCDRLAECPPGVEWVAQPEFGEPTT